MTRSDSAASGVNAPGLGGQAGMTAQDPAQEPSGVAQVVTPSGLEIYYQSGPKRLYRIREHWPHPLVDPPISQEWQEVPSVSTVLGVLDKPALVWWGMKVGIAGTLQVSNLIPYELDGAHITNLDDVEPIVQILKEQKLTTNHVKNRAADRGTNVHSALEAWAETGVTPDPQFFPENERGYVQGLVNFLRDAKPQVEHSELMVASLDGFAGRFDLVAQIDSGVVTKTYPKKPDVVSPMSGRVLIDMKTSKDCYPTHHLQLAAYWRAMGECGYGTPDTAAILRVTEDGRYELVECRAIYEDFKRVLDTYNSIQRIKGK